MAKKEFYYRGKKVSLVESDRNKNLFTAIVGGKDLKGVQMIDRSDDYWSILDIGSSNLDSPITVYLYDDNSIGYSSEKTNKEIVKIDRKFDPRDIGDDEIDRSLQKLYDFVTEAAMQRFNIGIPASDIMELRKRALETTLRMLGYSSPSQVKKGEPDSANYMALNRVGGCLENYRNLAFIRRYQSRAGNEFLGFRIPKGLTRDQIRNLIEEMPLMIQDTQKAIEDDEEYMQLQSDINDRNQDYYVNPEYLKNMRQKANWPAYAKGVKQIAMLYLSLNRDLLSPEDAVGIEDLTDLAGVDIADRISEIIDSKSSDYSIAAAIEDQFFKAETLSSNKVIEGSLDADLPKSLQEQLREVYEQNKKLLAEIERHEENYGTMQRLYTARIGTKNQGGPDLDDNQ